MIETRIGFFRKKTAAISENHSHYHNIQERFDVMVCICEVLVFFHPGQNRLGIVKNNLANNCAIESRIVNAI
jgi:hypothetical protein